MHHGELIYDYNDNYDKVHKLFCSYFNNPTMTKTKDVENHSVYMTKTNCLLSNMCRYIVVFVNKDNNDNGVKKEMNSLFWTSIQTRELQNIYDVQVHNYEPSRDGKLNKIIIKKEKSEDGNTFYNCSEFPELNICLIDGKTQYQATGTLAAALETYQTIITKV